MFTYQRSVRFQETDGAGVVYFANLLSFCHEAYEASLTQAGINLRDFFSGEFFLVPILHAEIDFQKPLFCGDQVSINLVPSLIKSSQFKIDYDIVCLPESTIARAQTLHIFIDSKTRKIQPLSDSLKHWLRHWSEGKSSPIFEA